ncbi:MAG: nuclear transport factor 2 family protein [Bacteroidota bacterium]
MNLFICLFTLCTFINEVDTNEDFMAISNVAMKFAKSADNRNTVELESIMHSEFRAIVNQAMGSKEMQLIDKSTYLDLIRKEVIGGDQREVHILSIDMENNNAVVKVKLIRKQLHFYSFMQLVKEANGHWKLISDLPNIVKQN